MLTKHQFDYTDEPLYSAVLDNGLQVYLYPKKGFAEMSALLQVNFGSLDSLPTDPDQSEHASLSGLAHFLEHKIFEQADGGDAALEFSKLSAESNAFTSYEKTAYYFSSNGQNLEALDLLQDFVMTADFDQASVDREKSIIAQEIDMYLDDVDYKVYSGILKNLYPDTDLAKDIAGSSDSLEKITLKDLKDSHHTYYTPANMSLFVVGDFDKDRVFDSIVKKQSTLTTNFTEIDKKAVELTDVVKRSSVRQEVTKPKLAFGIRLPNYAGASVLHQMLKLRFLFSILFGWTSQTYQNWYDDGLIDDSFDIDIEVSKRFQFIILTGDTLEPIKLANQISSRLNNFATSADFSEDHLESLKREFYGEFIRSLDSVDHLLNHLAANQTETESYLTYPKLIAQTNLADLEQLAKELLETMETSEFTVFPN